ncbi:unnamed protein product, partial [Polarella glacialis]
MAQGFFSAREFAGFRSAEKKPVLGLLAVPPQQKEEPEEPQKKEPVSSSSAAARVKERLAAMKTESG